MKYPAVLVVCGCPSRCANVSDLAVPAGRLIFLSGWEELLPAKEKLAEALKGQQTRSLTHEEVLDILPHRGAHAVHRHGEPPGARGGGGGLLPRPAGAALLRGPLPRNAGAPRRLHHRGRRPGGGHPDDDHGALRREAPPVHGGAGGHLPAENPAGDTLEIHVSLLEEKTERAIAACRGQVFVEGVLAADLELRLAFR